MPDPVPAQPATASDESAIAEVPAQPEAAATAQVPAIAASQVPVVTTPPVQAMPTYEYAAPHVPVAQAAPVPPHQPPYVPAMTSPETPASQPYPAPAVPLAEVPGAAPLGQAIPSEPEANGKSRRTWVRPTVFAVTGTFVAMALFSGGVFVGHGIGDRADATAVSANAAEGSGGSLQDYLEGLEGGDGSLSQDPRAKALPGLPDTSPDSGDSTGQPGSVVMVVGEVTAIDGANFTLKTSQESVAVKTDSETTLPSNLAVGDVVMVIGTTDSDGNLAATRIVASDAVAPNPRTRESDEDGGAADGASTDQTSLT